MQNRKKIVMTTTIALIGATSIILFSSIGLLEQQQAQAQSSRNSTFTTYTNAELGYSINYPSVWNVQHFPFFSTVYISSPDSQVLVVITVTNETGKNKNMTFQDMVNNDPQANSTADHRTVDATGNIHLLAQPVRRIESSYLYTDPITIVSTLTKSIAFETIVSERHITITTSAPAIDFDRYTHIFTHILDSFKLNEGN
jgi:hypothetical protein